MKPTLNPERDLKGASPEALARALLRNDNVPPTPGKKGGEENNDDKR